MGSDLAKADVALLQLIQTATRLEKNEKADALEKAKLWMTVANYSGENPFQQSAKKRSEDWDRVALAEAQRAVKAKKVCEKNASDSGKLGKLLASTTRCCRSRKKTPTSASTTGPIRRSGRSWATAKGGERGPDRRTQPSEGTRSSSVW